MHLDTTVPDTRIVVVCPVALFVSSFHENESAGRTFGRCCLHVPVQLPVLVPYCTSSTVCAILCRETRAPEDWHMRRTTTHGHPCVKDDFRSIFDQESVPLLVELGVK